MFVKILSCSAALSVGSYYLLCMLAIYVFTVSNCVWVRNGVESRKDLFLLLCCSSNTIRGTTGTSMHSAEGLKKIIINFVTEIIHYLSMYSIV
jgi:hypothetical protein